MTDQTFHLWTVLFLGVMCVFHTGNCAVQNNGQHNGQYNGQHVGHGKGHEVPGQGYRSCGHYKCVRDVVCNRGANKCPCPAGSVGNGHIQCAQPDRTCLCTIYGDPHIINFRGKNFMLPLPCSHVIANLTTPPTSRIPGGCQLFVSGRAWYPDGGANSDISFENQIEITLQTAASKFTTCISKTGFTKTHLTGGGSVESGSVSSEENVQKGESSGGISSREGGSSGGSENVNDVQRGRRDANRDIDVLTDEDEAGFRLVFVSACNILIKYRASDGSFALKSPIRTADHEGLCGPCDARWNQSSSDNPFSSRKLVLQLLLASLQSSSPIDNTDTNIYPSCTKLTKTVQDCPVQKKKAAADFCGEMLISADVRTCLSRKLGSQHVQDRFTTCYDAVCSSSLKCDQFRQLFSECGKEAHLSQYLKDQKFCQQ